MADENPTLDSTEVPKPDLNRICEQCGREFVLARPPSKQGHGRWCSKSCAAKARPKQLIPIEWRFWRSVNIARSVKKCWPWTGARDAKGYGHITLFDSQGRKIGRSAHRLAFELAFDTVVPDGLCACHHCDNPSCCNPWHIFIGTYSDNMRDSVQKGRIGNEAFREQKRREKQEK